MNTLIESSSNRSRLIGRATRMLVVALAVLSVSACSNGEDISGTAGMMQPRSIGGQVGHPLGGDAVGPGQGEVEEPVAAARVDLFRDVDEDGLCEEDVVETTLTDTEGNYVFDDLDEGDYCVGAVTDPTAILDAADISLPLDIDASATEGVSIDITVQ